MLDGDEPSYTSLDADGDSTRAPTHLTDSNRTTVVGDVPWVLDLMGSVLS